MFDVSATFVPHAAQVPKEHTAQARRRYQAMLREGKDILKHLPQPGESLHALMTGLYDFMTLIGHVITTRPPCLYLRIATLAFSLRNVAELKALLEAGAVKRLDLLASDFFEKHNKALYSEAQRELGQHGARVSSARCHAKVTCLEFPGMKLVFEGSANLRTNNNWEQFALFRDDGLHDWHCGWMEGKHGAGEEA